jgi:acyl phosphate:glycerol-3-phosphate acyltransferase
MPSLPLLCLFALAGAYVVGATPFGYLAGRWRGMDIRQHGSGNIGATNVIRVLGKKIGIPIFILDVVKGWLPVFLTMRWCAGRVAPQDAEWASMAAALGTVLGHNFTFWLGFRGGKGVATSAGSLLGMLPGPLGLGVGAWIGTFLATRYVALASLASAFVVPGVTCWQAATRGTPGWPLAAFTVLLGLLVIWRHRSNIVRLIHGTENRFVRKAKKEATYG